MATLLWTVCQWMLCVPFTFMCIQEILDGVYKCALGWYSLALLCEFGIFCKVKSVKLSPNMNDI